MDVEDAILNFTLAKVLPINGGLNHGFSFITKQPTSSPPIPTSAIAQMKR